MHEMSDIWTMRLSGIEVPKAVALERFPALHAALTEIGLEELTVDWSDEHERIVITYKRRERGDDTNDDETDERIWDVFASVYPDARIFQEEEAAVKIEDDLLGTLYWDESSEDWMSVIEIAEDCEVEVTLDPEGGDLDPLLARGRLIITDFQNTNLQLRRTAADCTLLALFNELNNESKPLSRDQLVERLWIQSMTISRDNTRFYYDDDGMFRAYLIVIVVDAQGQFQDAFPRG